MEKLLDFIKRCPLATLIIVSAALLTIIGIAGTISGKYESKISMKHPFVASVLEPKQGGTTPGAYGGELSGDPEVIADYIGVPGIADDDEVSEVAKEEPSYEPQEVYYEERAAAPPRSIYYDDPQKTPLTTMHDYIGVSDEWFSDALFIGDSRMEGWSAYGALSTPTFIYKEGINTTNLFTEAMTTNTGEYTTLASLLATNKYSKIYMMMGINDLGIGTIDEFETHYKALIDQIRYYQPDTTLFLFGIVNVTNAYSLGDDVVNNDNVNARNCRIAGLSDGVKIYYFDLNGTCCDEYGGLNEAYTSDGVHLRAEYYPLWSEFVREHGIE